SPRSTSLRTRARWKRPSPLTTPATCQSTIPSTTPSASTATAAPDGRANDGRRTRTAATASVPIPPSTASARSIDAWTANTTVQATNTAAVAQTSVADAERWPSARATSQPGASTTTVAPASRRNSVTAPAFGALTRFHSLAGRAVQTTLGREAFPSRQQRAHVRRGQIPGAFAVRLAPFAAEQERAQPQRDEEQ